MTVVVLLVAVELARAGIADFLRLEPCHYLDSLQLPGRRPDPMRLRQAREQLELANKFDPRNPIIREYLGILYYHRAAMVASDLALAIGFLEIARDHYLAVIELRKNSGYAWAGLMTVRSSLYAARQAQRKAGQRVAEDDVAGDLAGLRQALWHATRLAPWEKPVLQAVVETGRARYDVLDAPEREAVDAAVARARQLGLPVDSKASR